MGISLPLRLTGFVVLLCFTVFIVGHGWSFRAGAEYEAALNAGSSSADNARPAPKTGVPTALIKGHGLLDANCRVVDDAERVIEGMPVFDIESGVVDEETCRQIRAIQPFLRPQVTTVTVLSNGDYRVRVGAMRYVIADASAKTFDRMWRVHRQLARQTGASFIADLRYTSGLAVRTAAGG